ncbi:MAG: Mur ligase family protein [Alphaproteobacteria bacterium]|nr:Mur ligase family protein [Alphaproteobacteria bacterium]
MLPEAKTAQAPVLPDITASDWNYSADPALDAMIAGIRDTYPPHVPAGLDRFRVLLAALGDPQLSLPPVFHVAGTNGKGSTVAFLQAMLEAGGKRVHRFISPHLVRFSERIVVGGHEIDGALLKSLIAEVDAAARGREISFFEFFTALAFLAFARHPADAVLLEVGLGGLLDATNVIENPACAVITRISYDHMRTLGDTLPAIAAQKAGIIKRGCPAVVAPQFDDTVLPVFDARARETGASPLLAGGRDWHVEATAGGFRYTAEGVSVDLPSPALHGAHQILNAGAAITALRHSPFAALANAATLTEAMTRVRWAGRLEHLQSGALATLLPAGWELWVDGAHNDSGAETLRAQIDHWAAADGLPLHLLTAFKARKSPDDFFRRLSGGFASAQVVGFDIDAPMEPSDLLAALLAAEGYDNIGVSESLPQAMRALFFKYPAPARILVTGSLYLVGHALKLNDAAG